MMFVNSLTKKQVTNTFLDDNQCVRGVDSQVYCLINSKITDMRFELITPRAVACMALYPTTTVSYLVVTALQARYR